MQKSDIAKALSEDEMYDFLIDIVPREETNPSKSRGCSSKPNSSVPSETGLQQCLSLIRILIIFVVRRGRGSVSELFPVRGPDTGLHGAAEEADCAGGEAGSLLEKRYVVPRGPYSSVTLACV